MPAFYNRRPWNVIIGLGGLTAGLFAFAAATSWWVLLAPLALIAIVNVYRQVVRAYALAMDGYHAQSIRGGKLRYEEIHGSRIQSFSLKLENTEPGHYELFIPDETRWAEIAPDWAGQRRLEIAERIAKSWRRSGVHL